MIVFHMDLDNTLIYSYKHDIGPEKRNVEIYQGREVSFITEKTYRLLKEVSRKSLLVLTSTRTREQYQRIRLGIGSIRYALVCNGGVLLKDGVSDDAWYQKSRELADGSRRQIEEAKRFLKADPRREFELRWIGELFLFTKCRCPESVTEELRRELGDSGTDVFHNGNKVYVVPRALSKGNALRRFRQYTGAEQVWAAGDSAFDCSMLEEADRGFAPHGFKEHFPAGDSVAEMPGAAVFSEELLEAALACLNC